jgi:hypothetical protein
MLTGRAGQVSGSFGGAVRGGTPMWKSELVRSGLGALTFTGASGVLLAAVLWWGLHPAWAALLGAGTLLAGWAAASAAAFALFVRDVSRAVPCPRCRRALSVLSLRADGQPGWCPACGVISTEPGAGASRPVAAEPGVAPDPRRH